jgi:hypothetical protein
MQDFQEVIEDSQLMNAMYDDTPRPIQEWYHASQDEMEIYESKLRKLDNNRLEIEYICTTSLGFFLVLPSFLDLLLISLFL